MPQQKYLLSIDQSTSATKVILFNDKAELVSRKNKEHQQYYPQPGWVEHDPTEIYNNTLALLKEVLTDTSVNEDELSCLSITNQRETVVLWDRQSGEPVHNAIVWQCMRGTTQCDQLKAQGHEAMIREKTGLIIDPYFSASGLSWILANNPDLKERAKKGELATGTIDSWLIWKLTNGRSHATDYSNACRTLLFNIHTLEWDNEICDLFDIPVAILPEVKAADDIFGTTTLDDYLKKPLSISGVLGDSHAALFGQFCYHPGFSKSTYGTGSSVMMNIGDKAKPAPDGLVTSIGYKLKTQIAYVFEGNIHSTGYTIKWMSDQAKLLKSSQESEALALSVNSTNGVYMVPAFSGLGAPYWNNDVRACISGISGGTTNAHLVRAGLEAIVYQVKDLLDLMSEKAGINLAEIRADGGPTNNNFLMQFQADMLNTPIAISNLEEASALGAALAGGLGTGVWNSVEKLETLYKSKGVKLPSMSEEKRDELYTGWQQAVQQLLK